MFRRPERFPERSEMRSMEDTVSGINLFLNQQWSKGG